MINNIYLTSDEDIHNKNINFNSDKDKLIISSTDDKNIITKVDDSFFPVVKYSKYVLELNKIVDDLVLNKTNEIYTLKDGDDNIFLQTVNILNLEVYGLDMFDMGFNKIYYDIIYSSKTLKYYYKIKIKLNDCDLYISVSNFISLDVYDWHKKIDLYLLYDNYVVEFSLNDINDLIKILNKYSINNKELKQFCKYLNFYNDNFIDYTINDYLEDLKINIENSNVSLNIGPRKMKRINDGLLKFFLPINSNDCMNIYLTGSQSFRNPFRFEYLKSDLTENEKKECNILIRQSESIRQYINNYSKINVYTGEVIDTACTQVYIDNEGLIIKYNRSVYNKFYFTKLNNIWVHSNGQEIEDIKSRYALVNALTI